MLATSFDFTVPRGWHELSDRQLLCIYRLMASDFSVEEIQIMCMLRWNSVKVIGRRKAGENFILMRGRTLFEVAPRAMAELLPSLDWMAALPDMPVRLTRIGKHTALSADFAGVPFETYLATENYYQGFIQTRSDAILDEMAALLYPGLRGELSDEHRIAVFYWAASLKEHLARRFPDFFQPVSSESEGGNLLGASAPQVEEAMNAQIRALTKGDVTKEREILALDTHRALTELNAQAREYRELNSKLNAKR